MKRLFQTISLLAVLALSTGLALGLTYAPCYATICPESYLARPTRVHIATFYAFLAITACFLYIRAVSPRVQHISNYYLVWHELPVLKRRVSLGGLALGIWIVGVNVGTTWIWFQPLLGYWGLRTDPYGWVLAQMRLTITGVIGHHADILLGLVIIPVSRNSILGQVFQLHQSTLLYAHKLIAYLLFAATFAHAMTYFSFVGWLDPVWGHWSSDSAQYVPTPKELSWNPDNPTQTLPEAMTGNAWSSRFALPGGVLAFALMMIIIITSLSVLRRNHYNVFYYLHVFCSISVFVFSCAHTSTNFYCLLPGLILLVVDWGLRASKLMRKGTATVENIGDGWYRVQLPVTATSQIDDDAAAEKQLIVDQPIQSYSIIFPEISKLQNHPFTAAKVGSTTGGPVLLFQRTRGKKKQKKLDKEWTWKLGSTVPSKGDRKDIHVRVEGPYIPVDTEYLTASRVICIVGGTGITGAWSLANWWLENRGHETQAKFFLLWTVRDRAMSSLREWRELEDMTRGASNMDIKVHVSSESGRVEATPYLREILCRVDQRVEKTTAVVNTLNSSTPRAWVYVSGPEGMLSTVETACLRLRSEVRGARKGNTGSTWCVEDLAWHSAKWEV